MARNLILLAAILAAGMFVASSPAQIINLKGPHSLKWTDWEIEINHLEITDSVPLYGQGGKKYADTDSTFVYMELTVTNISHKGSSFIPQNILKIIIGDDAFDAERSGSR